MQITLKPGRRCLPERDADAVYPRTVHRAARCAGMKPLWQELATVRDSAACQQAEAQAFADMPSQLQQGTGSPP